MAAAFGGFAAVDAMTWTEYALARRYLTETRIGARVREAKRAEDDQAKKNFARVKRQER